MDKDGQKCCNCYETLVSSFKNSIKLEPVSYWKEHERGWKNIELFQKGKLEGSNKISNEIKKKKSFYLKGLIRLKKFIFENHCLNLELKC